MVDRWELEVQRVISSSTKSRIRGSIILHPFLGQNLVKGVVVLLWGDWRWKMWAK